MLSGIGLGTFLVVALVSCVVADNPPGYGYQGYGNQGGYEKGFQGGYYDNRPQTYTEVTYESWGSRLGNSMTGVLFAIVLFVISVVLLWWNEGRAVRTRKSLEEGLGIVRSIDSARVDSSNEGALIHITGDVYNNDEARPVQDIDFGVVAPNVLKLKRQVEMYQWKQSSSTRSEKQMGGGVKKTTTYSYTKTWSSSVIDSSNFKRSGYDNPSSIRFKSNTWTADRIKLAGFNLSETFSNQISNYSPIRLDYTAPSIQHAIRGDLSIKPGDNGFYVGGNPHSPAIGDLKVTYSVCEPGQFSAVGKQNGFNLTSYRATAGNDIALMRQGMYSAKEMFDSALAGNTVLTWILRFVGWLLMFISFALMGEPLGVLADVLPFLGSLVRFGLNGLGFIFSIALSLIIIAIAWLFYRPLLSVMIFASVFISMYVISML